MKYQEAKEIHDLFFSLMGLFHEKFVVQFRKCQDCSSWMKKNHSKIMNILYQAGHLTSTEIGKKLDIEKGSLTTLIDQLVEKGLAVRCIDSKDRRKVLVSLSEAGKEEMEKSMDCAIRKINEYLNEANPKEMNQFVVDLQNVVDFMERL